MKILLTASLVAGLACVAVSAPANAQRRPVNEGGDTQPCVTYAEFKDAFHIGMPEHRVQRVFDTKGRPARPETLEGALDAVGGPSVGRRSVVRSYRTCEGGLVFVEFRTWRRHRAMAGAWT